MTATTVDLRYKTHDVLRSLDRGESVVITFRGKTRGIITPPKACNASSRSALKVTNHPFFGSAPDATESVEAVVDRLRGGRYRDL